ncbi:MAG: hypothetical protein DMF92_06310, partial [Acidobacteria bacterium]
APAATLHLPLGRRRREGFQPQVDRDDAVLLVVLAKEVGEDRATGDLIRPCLTSWTARSSVNAEKAASQ